MMRFIVNRWPGKNRWHSVQWSIGENTIAVLCDRMWFRLERWKQQGYWVTWYTEQSFGERHGYESPIWQIGRGKWFRVACFSLATPEWYYEDEKEKQNVRLRRVK